MVNATDVLSRPVGGASLVASVTKRVLLWELSWIPRSSTSAPWISAARAPPIAAAPSTESTCCTAAAFEKAGSWRASGSMRSMYFRHWLSACGCAYTTRTSSSFVPGLAMRQCSTASTVSARMSSFESCTSTSTVRVTVPSRLFSIASTPSSASPASTAAATADSVGYGMKSASGQ